MTGTVGQNSVILEVVDVGHRAGVNFARRMRRQGIQSTCAGNGLGLIRKSRLIMPQEKKILQVKFKMFIWLSSFVTECL